MTDMITLSRRQTLAAAAAVLAAGPAGAQPGPMASGRVFDEAAGPGIPGVMVSNGRDVVTTDAAGHWALPVRDGDSLFVIKPSGWMTPVDANQMPRFAYVHDPFGTPTELGFRFAGMSPTGLLPASIDFPLRRQQELSAFGVILFTDPQPESLAELGYVRDDVVAQTIGIDAAFGITHGDLMFDDLAHYERFNRIVGSIGRPWYSCPGNHDMNFEAPDNVRSRDTFKRVFGARHFAFQYGPATFIVLDNVEYLGTDPKKPNGFGSYQGRFGPDQLAFVRGVLANVPRNALVVFSFHIPLRTLFGTEASVATVDTADFLAAIGTHPNSVSFSGHTHTNEHWYFGQHHHHVLSAVSGSWWSGPFDVRGIPVALASDGTPNGLHVLSINGAEYTTRLIPAHEPQQSQMRIMLDSQLHRADAEILGEYPIGALLAGPIAREAAASTRLVVNVFDGGPRSKVEFAAGGGAAYTPMQRVERNDPFVEEVYARNAATKKPWVKPSLSSHIWQATLPAALPAGTHRISVRATDEFGRAHTGFIVLEIT